MAGKHACVRTPTLHWPPRHVNPLPLCGVSASAATAVETARRRPPRALSVPESLIGVGREGGRWATSMCGPSFIWAFKVTQGPNHKQANEMGKQAYLVTRRI